MNLLKVTFLMTLMMVLLILAGGALGGRGGMVTAFMFAVIINFGSYWFSDKIVLALYKAKEVTEGEFPEIYRIVRNLTVKANLPMPKIYVMDNPTPNAFATGRNPEHSAVAVTTGILQILSSDELSGVIAHELSHIKHHDILIGTIAATFAGAIGMLANMAQWTMIFGGGRRSRADDNPLSGIGGILMIILAPIAAVLIQMAISRSREFLADEGGAHMAGNPHSLATALKKLQMGALKTPMEANPSTAHMFIVSPLISGGIFKLFSTHPPVEERIARLEAMRG